MVAVAGLGVILGAIYGFRYVTPDDPMQCVQAHETYIPATERHFDKTVTICDKMENKNAVHRD
jgi:hypothetical protein